MRLTESGIYRNVLTTRQLLRDEAWWCRSRARELRDQGWKRLSDIERLEREADKFEEIARE